MPKDKSLLQSAGEFLAESLNNYKAKKLNFAILHAVTSTELLLKERLYKINPSLIHRQLDSERIEKEKTIGLRELPFRLCNLGIDIDAKQKSLIKEVAEWRHQIVHHMPKYDRIVATSKLVDLYNFLAYFIHKELKANLKDLLPTALFKIVDGLIHEWDKIVADAQTKAKKAGKDINQKCPECSKYETLVNDKKKEALCCLCGKRFIYDICENCKQEKVGTEPLFTHEFTCNDCEENYEPDMDDIGD